MSGIDEAHATHNTGVNKGQMLSIQNGVAAVDCGNDKPISRRSALGDISGGTQ